MKLSIVIVNYNVGEKVLECVRSIHASGFKNTFEIIVVDNSPSKTLKGILKREDRNATYITSKTNVGFGEANNIGFAYSKGEFVFFLNPDTKVYKGTLKKLTDFLQKNKSVGVVAPILVDSSDVPYPLQGTKLLTPLRAIFALSFINKIVPKNPVSRNYWNLNWNKQSKKRVDVVPGTAFVVRREVFKKAGGFDKNLFLYFEEFDLAIRIKKLGFTSFIIPDAKVFHEWGASTKQVTSIKKIFSNSQNYYFKKNFGVLKGFLVNFVLGINKIHVLLVLALLLGGFLRFHKIYELMIFIGDQGWFYLSARDMIVNRTIPLVGIPSSVVWLAQGALATYLMAFALFVGTMHPVAPAILFILLDCLTIVTVFLLGTKLFNEKVGLFASLFYAVSPLIVMSSKMPYHTSAIPLMCSSFFIFIIESQKKLTWFPFCLLLFGLLIQLELSNIVLLPIILFFVWSKRNVLRKDALLKAIGFFCIGIAPFILYDLTHKFIQTAGFPLWIINRFRLFLGLTVSGNSTTSQVPNALHTIFNQFVALFFPESIVISIVVAILFLIGLVALLSHAKKEQNKYLLMWMLFPMLAFLIHASPGAAYFPLLFPAVALIVGFSVNYISKYVLYFSIFFFYFLYLNSFFMLRNDFYISTMNTERVIPSTGYSFGLAWVVIDDAAKSIVNNANGAEFRIIGGAFYGQFASNLDNLKYLLFWRGGKLVTDSKLTYTVYPNTSDIKNKAQTIYRSKYYVIVKNEKN